MKTICKHCGAVHEVDEEVTVCMRCGENVDGTKNVDNNSIIEFLNNLDDSPLFAEVS